MMPFVRQPALGSWWDAKQERLFELLLGGRDVPDGILGWTHEGRTVADWFHSRVRAPGEPKLCAYCDGALRETSVETIDHFFPKHAFPWLALAWENLYPTCERCNEHEKGRQWSCHLIRPDVDLVAHKATSMEAFSRLFDFDPCTGRLRPALEATRKMRARVRLTLRILGLNNAERCHARKRRWLALLNASKTNDEEFILEDAVNGPYRFVAEQFLAAQPTLSRTV